MFSVWKLHFLKSQSYCAPNSEHNKLLTNWQMLAKLDKLIRLNIELIDKLLRFGAIIQLFLPIN